MEHTLSKGDALMFHMYGEVKEWKFKTQITEQRFRVDACPVLAVKAEYPCLLLAENTESGTLRATAEAAERFNRFYAEAAERFTRGGIERFSEELYGIYNGLSPEAACVFARRELICRMTFEGHEEKSPALCNIKVERLSGYRRGGVQLCRPVCRHLWRFPEGILEKQLPVHV